jgi:hypothetical protein
MHELMEITKELAETKTKKCTCNSDVCAEWFLVGLLTIVRNLAEMLNIELLRVRFIKTGLCTRNDPKYPAFRDQAEKAAVEYVESYKCSQERKSDTMWNKEERGGKLSCTDREWGLYEWAKSSMLDILNKDGVLIWYWVGVGLGEEVGIIISLTLYCSNIVISTF